MDVFVRDIAEAETMRVSVTSDGEQYETFESEESASVYHANVREPQISDNGQVVVFSGNANRLVVDDVNYNDDIFIHQLIAGTTTRVSVRSDGGDAYGEASVECGRDPVCAQFTRTHSPSISADGTLVYFISAAPLLSDEDSDDEARGSEEQVFVRDVANGLTLLVSRYRKGEPVESSNWYAGAISADGRWVSYSNNSIKLDGRGGDQDPGPDVFLQRLP
jgi:Tol biopolymer transport system component